MKAAAGASPARGHRRSRWSRGLSLLFIVLVLGLLLWAARHVRWDEVLGNLRAYPHAILAGAAGLGILSHLIYSSYDLLGRVWVGHRLPASRVMQITFVSYAFNLNLGALIGGVALRFRLYAREGLGAATVARVLGLSMTSNWLGYGLLAGLVLSSRTLAPPPGWGLGAAALQALGVAMLFIVGAYMAACAGMRRRRFEWRGHGFELPNARLAAAQLLLSCANWLTMAAMLTVLFEQQLPYVQVLAVLLIAAVAGVVTHVPAGLGVLEAVFVTLLVPTLPQSTVLAALLAYRALYYLAPLLLAGLLYLRLESLSSGREKPATVGGSSAA